MAWLNVIEEYPGYTVQVAISDSEGAYSIIDPADYASMGIELSVLDGRVEMVAPDIDSTGGGYDVAVIYATSIGTRLARMENVVARCNDDPVTPQMTSAALAGTTSSPEEVSDVDGSAVVEFVESEIQLFAVNSTRPPI